MSAVKITSSKTKRFPSLKHLLDDEREERPLERKEAAEEEEELSVVLTGVSAGQFNSTISRIFSWSSKLRSVN